jgi:hypothetical protein
MNVIGKEKIHGDEYEVGMTIDNEKKYRLI